MCRLDFYSCIRFKSLKGFWIMQRFDLNLKKKYAEGVFERI